MRLVDQFYQFPGKCFFTGSSHVDKPILDTEHYVDGEGLIYIGGDFLEEACRLLGWVPPEQLELVEADNASLTERLAKAEADLAELEGLKQTIASVSATLQSKVPAPPAAANPVVPFSPHPLYGG